MYSIQQQINPLYRPPQPRKGIDQLHGGNNPVYSQASALGGQPVMTPGGPGTAYGPSAGMPPVGNQGFGSNLPYQQTGQQQPLGGNLPVQQTGPVQQQGQNPTHYMGGSQHFNESSGQYESGPNYNPQQNQGGYTSPQQYPNQQQGQNTSPNNNSMALPPGVPPTGLIGAEQAMQSGLQGGMNSIHSGVNGFSPYMQQGQSANAYQGNLSGANGAAAQQKAYDNFISSPGQAWLREKGERAVTRNASALGGLGGGRVQQELQRQGQGLAAQDFGNAFNRLGTLSDRGMMGASGAANLYGQGANMQYNTGMNVANARTQAGRDIAQGVQGTTSSLAELINGQGQGLSDMTGGLGALLAGAYDQNGQLNAGAMQELGRYLSGQGIDGASLWGGSGLGGGESQGTLNNWANLIGAGASIYGAYAGGN